MADYYLAASLVALRSEVNARWPNRDKESDGWIGNAAHAARKSDHNPDYSAGGVVRAIDVDKDGIDVQELLDATVRDQRVAYVIWNKQIASATDDGAPWDWEPYDGPNDHTHHIHISIKHTHNAETDTSPWFTEEEASMSAADVAELKRFIQTEVYAGPRYQALQNTINAVGTAVAAVLPYLKTEDAADDAALNKAVDELKAAIAAPEPAQ